jgi:hypothetical protein
VSDDLALTDKQNISEHTSELEDVADQFHMHVLQLIEEWNEENVNLGDKLPPAQQARAMYHIGYITGFAVGRDQTVAELFDELGLP